MLFHFYHRNKVLVCKRNIQYLDRYWKGSKYFFKIDLRYKIEKKNEKKLYIRKYKYHGYQKENIFGHHLSKWKYIFFKKQSVYRMESKLIQTYKTCKLSSSGLSHKTTCCKTVCRYQERMGRGASGIYAIPYFCWFTLLMMVSPFLTKAFISMVQITIIR